MALTYVLDTNVLLHDPKSLFHFEEHSVVVPIQVIEELDKFKKEASDRGQNARTSSRYLDKLRTRGSLRDGVALSGGGKLYVDTTSFPGVAVDDAIIQIAVKRRDSDPNGHVTLVTRDTNVRIKADCWGLRTEDYRHDKVPDVSSQYKGWREILDVETEMVDALFSGLAIDCEGVPNEAVVVVDYTGRSCLAITDSAGQRITKISPPKTVSNLSARNKEQQFALELLLNPKINLVTLSGAAGTGKTLIALAAALHQLHGTANSYQKILVARPVVPMGRDIGFLPGTMQEKLAPWMNPIFDNLSFLIPTRQRGKGTTPPVCGYQELLDQGLLEVEALAFIRGRSLPEQFMIVDEAQNLSPHEVKTILTRAGQGTKIVLTGDPEQIDNPYVDSRSNGLSYVVEKFRNSPLAGHVTLTKGERSPLAEAATKLL